MGRFGCFFRVLGFSSLWACGLNLVVHLYTSCVLRGALYFYFNKTIIIYQKKNKFLTIYLESIRTLLLIGKKLY